jgi:hypothetical protein
MLNKIIIIFFTLLISGALNTVSADPPQRRNNADAEASIEDAIAYGYHIVGQIEQQYQNLNKMQEKTQSNRNKQTTVHSGDYFDVQCGSSQVDIANTQIDKDSPTPESIETNTVITGSVYAISLGNC